MGQSWTPTPIGQATPILPPARSWQEADGGGFWGPSLSWNTKINAFVLLLNNVSGARVFDAEGNYITYLPTIDTPAPCPARTAPPTGFAERTGIELVCTGPG
ncbi:hypothetical protein [Gemmatimonas sp.]|uniref:hypothetical protein n=1 Tax=Gemmatimonas sp. TaxID=1962908 RepID=UPI003DA249DB